MKKQTQKIVLSELKQSLNEGERFVNALIDFNEGTITSQDFANECDLIFLDFIRKMTKRIQD